MNINNTHMMLGGLREGPLGQSMSHHTEEYSKALASLDLVHSHSQLFLCLFRDILDEVCQTYINLIIDSEGPQKDDHLVKQVCGVFRKLLNETA